MIDAPPAAPALQAAWPGEDGFLVGERRNEVMATFRPLPLPNGFATGIHIRRDVLYPLSFRAAGEFIAGDGPTPVGTFRGGVFRLAVLTTWPVYAGFEGAVSVLQSPFSAHLGVPLGDATAGWVLGARGELGWLAGAIEYRWDTSKLPLGGTPTAMLGMRY